MELNKTEPGLKMDVQNVSGPSPKNMGLKTAYFRAVLLRRRDTSPNKYLREETSY